MWSTRENFLGERNPTKLLAREKIDYGPRQEKHSHDPTTERLTPCWATDNRNETLALKTDCNRETDGRDRKEKKDKTANETESRK